MFIHPTAEVPDSVTVGEGTKVWHHVQVRDQAVIGRDCILGKGSYIDEGVIVGDRVKIQNRASIYKECVIEDGVFIGPHACITNDQRPRAVNSDGSLKREEDWYPGTTRVCEGASVGAGAIVLPGKLIGRYAMVGAGAVVTHDVPAHGLVVGNPARHVGNVCTCGNRLPIEENVCRDCSKIRNATSSMKPLSSTQTWSGGIAGRAPLSTACVVGLGKVGLPLAVQYASSGVDVIGCDINPSIVEAVNLGVAPIQGEQHLEERLAAAHRAGRIRAVTDTSEAVCEADVVVIIVPMMVDYDHNIDFRTIDSATAAVGRGIKPGTLVVYETTLPVGTTRNRFGAILERESGLRMGEDFLLAFSPERIRSGRIFRDLATYPKVVGGINEASTMRAVDFYASVLPASVMPVRDSETAELTKLMETSYRDVNIALANEFAVFAADRGLDVYEAIDAANSQEQSHMHQPGVGVGGHCIPVYPYFLLNQVEDHELRLPRTAREVNDGMAEYTTSLLARHLGGVVGRHVLIMGATYRADVKETAFSSAFLLQHALKTAGARVSLNDPLLSEDEIRRLGGEPLDLATADCADAVVIQATHSAYTLLPDAFFNQFEVVVDGRGDLETPQRLTTGTTWVRIGVGQPATESIEIVG